MRVSALSIALAVDSAFAAVPSISESDKSGERTVYERASPLAIRRSLERFATLAEAYRRCFGCSQLGK